MSNQDKYTELSCNCTANERKFLDEIKEKLVNNQKDIPQDVADIINKRFMDLF